MKKIGIGILEDPERVLESIKRFTGEEEIICYLPEDLDQAIPYPVQRSTNPGKSLVRDLADGTLSAAVRGTLPAHETLNELKAVCKVSELERIVLLELFSGEKFFLAPVGVDEGWTPAQKLSFIRKGQDIARRFGLSEKTAVLSGGRLGDIGRHPIVDRTLADAELVCRISGAVHYEIRIEDAIRECGLIIAPDGISGNLIFRTITFAGNGAAHGAPVVNIDKIFVDTSRVNPDYTNALILASSLID